MGRFIDKWRAVRLPAVPGHLTRDAVIPGMPKVRYWMPEDVELFLEDSLQQIARERRGLAPADQQGVLPASDFLAISGGGDSGAFGAGLLVGWTEAGNRPEFRVVTGVSTGALIAPFAFLGPECDEVLIAVYTKIGPKDISRMRLPLAVLFHDSLRDSRPLFSLISRHVNDKLLERIATEYEKGRWLLIATTDLDSRRPVLWNMGAIAASRSPNALDLFRNILLASAAIPGVFPPLMVDVEVDGKSYQEMHVDGGATAQVFLIPPAFANLARKRGLVVERTGRTAYIIRNSRLDPDWASVDRRAMSILGRTVTSMIHTQGVGDLYRIYLTTQQTAIEFNLAFIGSDFNVPHKEQFDTAFMNALYNYAHERALKGYQWAKELPSDKIE